MNAAPSVAEVPPDQHVLDITEIGRELTARGFVSNKGGAITPKTVRRWADEGKIPTFKTPSGRRAITLAALNHWILRMQSGAEKDIAAAPAKRRA